MWMTRLTLQELWYCMLIWYATGQTPQHFKNSYKKKVLKTLLLFYTTSNHVIHHRYAAASKVDSEKYLTVKFKIFSISKAQYLRNTSSGV